MTRVRRAVPLLVVNVAVIAAGLLAAEAVRTPEPARPAAVVTPSASPSPAVVRPSPSPVGSRAPIGALDSRSRDTNRQGAADIVVYPRGQVRAPVTGTVIRAGGYTLYCDHTDDYLVVEPDARPGWEVKMLHFEGLSVRTGDRVRAGVTVVGRNARLLPFASQVDDHTVAPHWPHLHVEVVDPSVKDRPSGRTCD